MKRKILAVAGAALLAVTLFACKGQPVQNETTVETTSKAEMETESSAKTESGTDEEKVYKIGVLQLVQHEALDLSNKGFFKALDDANIKYEADQQNAGGEQSTAQTIADKLVNDKNDLIFAIATPAAQAVAGLTKEIPVVITAVTDPASSGLVESNEKPGNNVTGTSDLTPVKAQIELLHKLLPEAKTVGMLYSSAESNSQFQIDIAHAACDELGLKYIDYTVSSFNEIQSIVESMVGKVDAIYAPTDNMISSGMATASMIATENNIPIIASEEGPVRNGGLATYGIDYYELGYLAGQQAVRILKDGENPAQMPIEYLPDDKYAFAVNEEIANTLGIDVSSIEQ